METTVMHVRLSSKDEKFIENAVREGYFTNKSSVIKTAIRLLEFSMLTQNLMSAIKTSKQVSFEETMKSIKESRRQTHKKHWK